MRDPFGYQGSNNGARLPPGSPFTNRPSARHRGPGDAPPLTSEKRQVYPDLGDEEREIFDDFGVSARTGVRIPFRDES